MSKINNGRAGCKDVFHAFLVNGATFEGNLEIPCINAEYGLPAKLVPFSKAVGKRDPNAWIHFYEDDVLIERIWNSPPKYLQTLKGYAGVISPDFSLYRDMPLAMQFWNIYRSHALGYWLQKNNIPVIANVRWGDERTFDTCCIGVPAHSTIAIGSHGCIKILRDRDFFVRGLEYVVNKLEPHSIIIYGAAPDSIFQRYRDEGISVLSFESEFSFSRRKAVSA